MNKILMSMAGAFLVGAVTTAYAEEPAKLWEVVPQDSKVGFLLHSTLHGVHGDALIVEGKFEQSHGTSVGRLVVPISSMKTYNNARDRNMYKMFESDKYPQIIYNVTSMDVSTAGGVVKISGTLSIHGVEKDFPLEARMDMRDGKLELSGEADVSIKEFGMKAPGVLGLIKVADTVNVTFQIVMRSAL